MKRKIGFFLTFLFILILFSVFFWLYEAQFFIGRASVSQTSFSVDNSYLFTTPLRAKANGKEKIRITIFLLNNQGMGALGKKIVINQDANLLIDSIQSTTDQYGKAFFDVASNKSGEYFIEVSVDGESLSQKAHLSFY